MTDNTPALADLASQINAEHEACHAAMRESVEHAVRAGELLIEAKAGVPHGEWAGWIDARCEFSDRTARAYMQIAHKFRELDDTKRQHAADLSQRRFLEALTQPPTTDETVDTAAEGRRLMNRPMSRCPM